jgi:hypothetical protein
MNFERGFRRITWVVSLGVALVVFAIMISDAPHESESWRNAGEPGPDWQTSVKISVLHGSRYYLFTMSPDFTDWSTLQIYKNDPEGATEIIKNQIDRDVASITRNNRWKELEKLPASEPAPEDDISFLYIPASQTRTSTVYTRKQILQAENAGKLTPEGKKMLLHAREKKRFPPPISEPRYTLLSWIRFSGYVAASGAVAFSIPWVAFLC